MIRALLLLALAAAPESLRAADARPPVTAALVQKIEACLGRLGDPGEHPELCMGLYSIGCMDAMGEESDGVVLCLNRETEAWAQIMDEEFALLLARFDRNQRDALNEAQTRWRAFQEADCAVPFVFEEPELARPWSADCVMQSTARRAMELRAYLNYLQ